MSIYGSSSARLSRNFRRSGGVHAVLIITAVAIVGPLGMLVLNAFKSLADMARNPIGLPAVWRFENFATAWDQANLGRYFLNTGLVAGSTVVLVLLLSSLAGFVLARYRFRGNGTIILLFVAGLAVPIQLIAVPLYILMRDIGLLDNLASVTIVYVASGLSFAVFLLVTSFRTIPRELEDAARIDGAGPLRVYWSVMLPLARPTLATVGVINFLNAWNEFFIPLVFLGDRESLTVTVGLQSFVGDRGTAWELLLPALVMISLPTILVLIIAAKQLVRGLNVGAWR